jgi:hypothetical protein
MNDTNERPCASRGSASFTPGPWVIPSANVFRVISLKDGLKPHRCIVDNTMPEGAYFGRDNLGWNSRSETQGVEAAANARLIAAAPSMFNLLERFAKAADVQGITELAELAELAGEANRLLSVVVGR